MAVERIQNLRPRIGAKVIAAERNFSPYFGMTKKTCTRHHLLGDFPFANYNNNHNTVATPAEIEASMALLNKTISLMTTGMEKRPWDLM
jgi:hypothetical protein